MSDGDYADILTMAWDDLPKPKLLPEGSWYLKGRNASRIEAKGDATEKVIFFYKVVEPMSDVSSVSIEALGADYDYNINDLVYTIYIESTADWQKKVLPHLAKHVGWEPGSNVQEGLKNFRNSEIVAGVGLKNWSDKQTGEQKTDNTLSGFVAPEK